MHCRTQKGYKIKQRNNSFSQINRKEDIEIDFTHIKKLSNYENHNYAFKRESIKIIAEKQCCNLMEHVLIHQSWNPFVTYKRMDIK